MVSALSASASLPRDVKPRSILVLTKGDPLGDGIRLSFFLRALRGTWPQAKIYWSASQFHASYAQELAPYVKNLIFQVMPPDWLVRSNWRALRTLFGWSPPVGRAFDLILDLDTHVGYTLVGRAIPHRLFLSAAAKWRFSDRKPDAYGIVPSRHITRRHLALIELAGGRIPAHLPEIVWTHPFHHEKAKSLLPARASYIGLAPGSSPRGRRRRWPLVHYVQLARRMEQHNLRPTFILGPSERLALSAEEKKQLGLPANSVFSTYDALRHFFPESPFPLQDLQEETNLSLTIAVCQRLQALVTHDCGVMNIAMLADTPMLVLFGPTSPEKSQPLVRHKVILSAKHFGSRRGSMQALPLDEVWRSFRQFHEFLANS